MQYGRFARRSEMGATVVVGVDDSAGARKALAWAADEAAVRKETLRVVHAYQLGLAWIDAGHPDLPMWEKRAYERARELLESLVDDVLTTDRRAAVEMRVVEGDPATVLLAEAAQADLVVVGSRGRGGFAGLLLGSVSQRLAQHAPQPVVIVPA
jgi:nucleotide-binding universal stress UspA family protein